MDIALKQRLVGASVLVALGVIFIPMLLDGPGEGDGANRRIPEVPDERFESRLLPVDPQQTIDDAREEESAVPPEPRPVPVTRPAPKQGESTVVTATEEPEPSAASDPVTKADPEPEHDAPAASPRQDDEPVPAEPATTSGGAWVLQLGSFGNAANADRLVRQLREAGYEGFQDRVDVGDQTLYRVRAGSWASKDDAAAAGERLAQRFSLGAVSVQELEDRPEPSAVEVAGWMVQVGSFSRQDNALGLRDRLREAGFSAGVERLERASGTIYRVRVGPELDRPTAEAVQQKLREQFELNGIVVSHP